MNGPLDHLEDRLSVRAWVLATFLVLWLGVAGALWYQQGHINDNTARIEAHERQDCRQYQQTILEFDLRAATINLTILNARERVAEGHATPAQHQLMDQPPARTEPVPACS